MQKLIALMVTISCLFICITSNSYAKTSQLSVKQATDVYITFRYKPGLDMHLDIGLCGINNTMNIRRIFLSRNYKKAVNPWVDKNAMTIMEACTDWIGPYTVKALNTNEDGVVSFTGGWHDSLSRKNTSKCLFYACEAKGQGMIDNKVYEGNVRIIAENLVMAYNTVGSGNFALKEHIVFDIVEGKVNVSVTTQALQDAVIYRYYGLQTQNSAWKGWVNYPNGLRFRYDRYSDSGTTDFWNRQNHYTVESEDGMYKLTAQINPGIGLYNFQNIASNLPSIFTEKYGKTYFNLINGKDLMLKKGDEISWTGSYTFE